jgi:hypothetical protein
MHYRVLLWTEQSRALLQLLFPRPRIAFVRSPIRHDWDSAVLSDCHTVLLWSGNQYVTSWGAHVFGAVGEACGFHGPQWQQQAQGLSDYAGRVFGIRDDDALLEVVMVTPSRIPRSAWASQGRVAIVESAFSSPKLSQHFLAAPRAKVQSLRLAAWQVPATLSLGRVLWHAGEHAPVSSLRVVNVAVRRVWKEHRFLTTKLFEIPEWRDASTVANGEVPWLAALTRPIPQGIRTHAPMVHFLRIYRNGMCDTLLVELDGGTGLVIDVRVTCQSLESLLLPDPYLGAAIAATLARA